MTSYAGWHVGMQVVCVIGLHQWGQEGVSHIQPPEEGRIYTINYIEPDGSRIFIGLDGYSPDVGFEARVFRPVQTRSTDISIFTEMLHRERIPEVA